MPKISAKFNQQRQMQAGWVKIGDFRQTTGYISKKYGNVSTKELSKQVSRSVGNNDDTRLAETPRQRRVVFVTLQPSIHFHSVAA